MNALDGQREVAVNYLLRETKRMGKVDNIGSVVISAALDEAKGSEELKQAGQSIARSTRTVAKTIELGLLPFTVVHHGIARAKAYFENRFADEMAERMATIPDDRLVEPSPTVAAQALQGLAYAHAEPDLKEMYLNLLATAMDRSTAATAHPAFAKILHELSPSDAGFFNEYAVGGGPGIKIPIVNLVHRQSRAGGVSSVITFFPALVDTRDDDGVQTFMPRGLPLAIENWVRLGLAEITYSESLAPSREDAYDWVTAHPEYRERDYTKVGDERNFLEIQRGILRITRFGDHFIQAIQARETQRERREGTRAWKRWYY